MDYKIAQKIMREIRAGNNVVKNIQEICEEISTLRQHAEYDRNLQPSVKRILHQDANTLEKELFFAVEAFIKSGTFIE